MSDRMRPIEFRQLIRWIFEEFNGVNTIFGIPASKFFFKNNEHRLQIFDEFLETPIGPAAGPHTQLSQNIISAYLTGGRFFELKTVQKLDRLEIDKPCIDAEDEGYNIEWSQELTLDQSYDEYLKSWFLLHMLNDLFGFSPFSERSFIFNMSVGYDLAGIKTARMDRFIDELKDASGNRLFDEYKNILKEELQSDRITGIYAKNKGKYKASPAGFVEKIDAISPRISGSVTLSTMHGCPPDEIESISEYLIREKGLHTYVKLNPTLLGYDNVKEILLGQGYQYIDLDPDSFAHDLQMEDAVPMIERLTDIAGQHGKQFGVKLSNTLGVNNKKQRLTGDQMYMSGRSLFPLTINLARRLSETFDGNINISYSGGATNENIDSLISTGIFPVTLVTDLLKPGGYERLNQISATAELSGYTSLQNDRIDAAKLKILAESSLNDPSYHKGRREIDTIKLPDRLPMVDCYISPCQSACPIHQDVSEYIRLIEEGRYADAFDVIVARNPLPHITGYICDHQCMNHCTRWDYDSPLQIRELKKYAAENGYEAYLAQFNIKTGQIKNGVAVAVIGAGPSGLSAAYFLAKAGFDVTIFEKSERAGGTVQHVIPDFRLPQDAIDNDIDFIKKHGVKFVFNTGQDFSIDKFKAEGFKYIHIAIGAMKSNPIRLDGNSDKVFDAVRFLKNYNLKNRTDLGKTVAVVGGGNSAMDGARAALRSDGVEKVYIIYRRTREFMPADKEEFDGAMADGVIFRELLLPVEFDGSILKCQKMMLGETGNDGRRKVTPMENAFEEMEISSVISAIGELVDEDILKENNIGFTANKDLIVDPETNETSIKNVFIGGDAFRGPSTVVESIADGKKVAEEIMKREKTGFDPNPDFSGKYDHPERTDHIISAKGNLLPVMMNDMTAEASRCLGCNVICNKCVEVCPNRANLAIPVNGSFKDNYQIVHMDALCNECGNCETFCPYNGAPYKDKMTLFWDEIEFNQSKNAGFFLKTVTNGNNSGYECKIRFESKVESLFYNLKDGFVQNPQAPESLEFSNFMLVLENLIENFDYLIQPQN